MRKMLPVGLSLKKAPFDTHRGTALRMFHVQNEVQPVLFPAEAHVNTHG